MHSSIMEEDSNFHTSTLTVGQEKAMAIVPVFSSLLSIFGSSVIIYQVIWKSTRKTPYKRILLGLSSCDIVASLAYALQCFLVPADSSRRYWAIGNDTSCSILGAFTQFAFAAVWYNGFLSYYYLATIRFKVDSKVFAKKYEPIIHFLALGFNLLTAVSGFLFHHYGEASVGPGCWVVSYYVNWPNGWVFAGIPVLFMFISIAASNLIIYCHIRGESSQGGTSSVVVPGAVGKLRHENVKAKAVATQAFGYVGTFVLCYTSGLFIKSLESFGAVSSAEAGLYPLLLFNSIFLPLQGFFNMVVYCHPSYITYRSRFPKESKLWAIRHALLASDLGSMQHNNGGVVNLSSMETGSQTSVGTSWMDSNSFVDWNTNFGRHTPKQRARSMISSVLFSVEEVGEDSDGSDHHRGMYLNTAVPQQPRAVDVLQDTLTSELCSDFESEHQAVHSIHEEEYDNEDSYSDDDDDSRMSSGHAEDDFLRHSAQIYLEANNKEEEPRACHVHKNQQNGRYY
jgi:hypothetical protein